MINQTDWNQSKVKIGASLTVSWTMCIFLFWLFLTGVQCSAQWWRQWHTWYLNITEYHGETNCIEHPRYLHTTHSIQHSQKTLAHTIMRDFSICLSLTVILSCFVFPTSSVTCYACSKGQVTPTGDCEEARRTQYCGGQEWCFKQWRGQQDNLTGRIK